MIYARQLTKEYRRFEKEAGLRGSVKSLLHRKYVVKAAVCGFDLHIAPGEFAGLIGPNGAGKTTLVKLLTGIIAKTSGELSVLGYDPNRLENAFKAQYAVVMGQRSQLFPELSAADSFLLSKALYGIPDAAYRRNLDYFTELFGLRGLLDVQVRTLSLGERMKMELAAALLHDPKVLFLDEPTIGLDAVAQKQIRGFLRQVNAEKGTTILLTSHYMEDIRSLCRRCVVINRGRKLYDGDTEALFARYQTRRRITALFEAPCAWTPPPDTQVLEQGPYKLSFLAPNGAVGGILRDMLAACALSDLRIEEEDIANVVRRIYNGDEGAGEDA